MTKVHQAARQADGERGQNNGNFSAQPSRLALQADPGRKSQTASLYKRQIAQILAQEFSIICLYRDGTYTWKPYASEGSLRPWLKTRVSSRIEQLEGVFSAAGELASAIDPLIIASSPFAEECFSWVAKYSSQGARQMLGYALERFQWHAAHGVEGWRANNQANAALVQAVLGAMDAESQVVA